MADKITVLLIGGLFDNTYIQAFSDTKWIHFINADNGLISYKKEEDVKVPTFVNTLYVKNEECLL